MIELKAASDSGDSNLELRAGSTGSILCVQWGECEVSEAVPGQGGEAAARSRSAERSICYA